MTIFLNRVFILLLTCVVVITAGPHSHGQESGTSESTTKDWPRFLGPDINNTSPATGIQKDWSDGKLKLLWQTELGEGYSMASVADGKVYQFDKSGDQGRLRVFDLQTGKSDWEYKYDSNYKDTFGYDSGPRSSPLIDGDRVYLFGVEGNLICLDINTHKAVWKIDTAEKFGVIQNFFGVASSPVIFKDKLIVMVGGSPAESADVPPDQLDKVKPDGSAIVAFDKLTGEMLYAAGDDLASYTSLTWMKDGTEQTLIAWARDNLWGFDPEDGKVKFQKRYRSRKLESVNAATPISIGNRIFLSECYENGSILLTVVDDKLETVWSDKGKRKASLQSHWCTPVVEGDFLYGCSGRDSNTSQLRCVQLSTGEVKWAERGFGRCSTLLIDGHLIVIGERGRLALVKADPEEYQLVTERKPDDQLEFIPNCWSAPVVAEGKLLVRGGEKLACFQLIPSDED